MSNKDAAPIQSAELAELTRYEEYGNESGGGLQEAADGDFVRLDDVIAALAATPAQPIADVSAPCRNCGLGCAPSECIYPAADVSAPTDERAAFEAWYEPKFGKQACLGDSDQYYLSSTQGAWQAWQAASAAAPVSGPSDAVAEIAARFPELNMSNYGPDEVDALNAWGIEICEALDDAKAPSATPVSGQAAQEQAAILTPTDDQIAGAVRAFVNAGKGGADMMGAIRRAVEEANALAPLAAPAIQAQPLTDAARLNAKRYEFLRDEAWKRKPDLCDGGRAAIMIGNHGEALDRTVDAAIDRLAGNAGATGDAK